MLALLAITIGTLGIGFTSGWLGTALFIAGMGIGLGFSYVATAMLMIDWFGKRANLELYSMMQLISTSAAIGPALGGLVRDSSGSFGMVFIACAAMTGLFAILTLAMRRPSLPASAEPSLTPATAL